jgi:hypothetical protein
MYDDRKVVDVRFVLDYDTDVEHMLGTIGANCEGVLAAAQLEGDGFGRILPRFGANILVFVAGNKHETDAMRDLVRNPGT